MHWCQKDSRDAMWWWWATWNYTHIPPWWRKKNDVGSWNKLSFLCNPGVKNLCPLAMLAKPPGPSTSIVFQNKTKKAKLSLNVQSGTSPFPPFPLSPSQSLLDHVCPWRLLWMLKRQCTKTREGNEMRWRKKKENAMRMVQRVGGKKQKGKVLLAWLCCNAAA